MSHAARMDAIYGMQRHIYDATRKYYLFGRDTLIADLDAGEGVRVLEIGCGTARNLIRAARRWPRARFWGIDISSAMLAVARRKIARAGLADRIVVAQADAAGFDPQALFGIASFDRTIFSYTLSMIPPWREALAQGLAVTAPHGRLTVVDFGMQGGWPAPWRHAFLAWLRRFDVTPREALPEEIERLMHYTGRPGETRALWGGYAMTARIG